MAPKKKAGEKRASWRESPSSHVSIIDFASRYGAILNKVGRQPNTNNLVATFYFF